jgi:hypothetical protein
MIDQMPRCDSCRWWFNDAKPGGPYADWGECKKAEGESATPVHDDTLAYAEDRESYKASLNTHRTFGCVMHEPQEGGEG